MNFESLRSDRSMLDFHGQMSPLEKIEAELVLIEWLPDGFFPRAYLCPTPSNNYSSNKTSEFILLGEVREFQRGNKTLFLKSGTSVFYNYLVIVSKTTSEPDSHEKQEDEFHKALQSLLDAIRVQAKIEVKDKMNGSPIENIRKLRAMIKIDSLQNQDNESLDAIKNSNKRTEIRESHNRLFELHL